MNLKTLMKESFIREANNPSFLPREKLQSKSPCSVSGNSGWLDSGGFASKSFSFSSRISMHSFCEYVFDLEQQHAMRISLGYSFENDEVEIKIPHSGLGNHHFSKFFLEIDNIYFDVTASFQSE